MKKIIFLPLFFICLLTFQSLAQETEEAPASLPDQELLRLTLKVDPNCTGTGCAEGLEEAARTFAVIKAIRAEGGGLAPDGLYLEKHQWEVDQKDRPGRERLLSTHLTDPIKTDTGTEYVITYPSSSGMALTIKYRLGAFDPETKTQDLTIEDIKGLLSYKEGGIETKKNFSFRWQLKQKEDGSFEIWDKDENFKLQNIELGIGAHIGFGVTQGATYLERQGQKEFETEEGKKWMPVNQREIVLKASSCSDSSPSTLEKLIESTRSIFSKI
ncbi:MAG: hypothetical protein HYY61_00625 [Deltaproteobacteria bacterium]|nr:hypothetical protein [Deltaproteobacteria bacterium]